MLTLCLRSTKPEDKAPRLGGAPSRRYAPGSLAWSPPTATLTHGKEPGDERRLCCGCEVDAEGLSSAGSTRRTWRHDGQTYQRLVGWPEMQTTDRVRIGRATFVADTYEQLHWHPIEACYYVISGSATVCNLEGEEFEVSAGSIVYAPAGIAGAHEWEVHDSLELLDIRATNETNRKMQFTVDKETKRFFIDLEDLAYRDAISFTSHY